MGPGERGLLIAHTGTQKRPGCELVKRGKCVWGFPTHSSPTSCSSFLIIRQGSPWKQVAESRLLIENGFEIDGIREFPLSQNLKEVSTSEQRSSSCLKTGRSCRKRHRIKSFKLRMVPSRHSVEWMNESINTWFYVGIHSILTFYPDFFQRVTTIHVY